MEETIARESIRATLSRYNLSGDRGRLADLARCFTEQGVLEIEGELPLEGRDAIETGLGGGVDASLAAAEAPLVRHHVSSIGIEMESPDRARVWSYFFVITEVGPDHWGRYIDRFERAGDAWLIAHRRVKTEGVAPGARMAKRRR